MELPGAGGAQAAPSESLLEFTRALIASRQNVSPKRLVGPGPDSAQMELLFEAAAAAPDHGELTPWQFIVIPSEKRQLLGDAFARALLDRDREASHEQVEAARNKALRGPLLILAISRPVVVEPKIPELEQTVSLGCAIQNILLLAHAMGFGAGLVSGQAMESAQVRELFGLGRAERPVCFITVGTVASRKPLRKRPDVRGFVREL